MRIALATHDRPCDVTRDVLGKEREKNGKGTRSFLSRSSILGTRFFPVSGQNHEKRVKNEAEWPKNGRKDVKRRRTAVPRRSKL